MKIINTAGQHKINTLIAYGCKCCAEANFAKINQGITIAYYWLISTFSKSPGTCDCV